MSLRCEYEGRSQKIPVVGRPLTCETEPEWGFYSLHYCFRSLGSGMEWRGGGWTKDTRRDWVTRTEPHHWARLTALPSSFLITFRPPSLCSGEVGYRGSSWNSCLPFSVTPPLLLLPSPPPVTRRAGTEGNDMRVTRRWVNGMSGGSFAPSSRLSTRHSPSLTYPFSLLSPCAPKGPASGRGERWEGVWKVKEFRGSGSNWPSRSVPHSCLTPSVPLPPFPSPCGRGTVTEGDTEGVRVRNRGHEDEVSGVSGECETKGVSKWDEHSTERSRREACPVSLTSVSIPCLSLVTPRLAHRTSSVPYVPSSVRLTKWHEA